MAMKSLCGWGSVIDDEFRLNRGKLHSQPLSSGGSAYLTPFPVLNTVARYTNDKVGQFLKREKSGKYDRTFTHEQKMGCLIIPTAAVLFGAGIFRPQGVCGPKSDGPPARPEGTMSRPDGVLQTAGPGQNEN